MKLISYKNDPKLKETLVEEIKNHRKKDQIIQGTYGKEEDGEWRGCAVGCSIHSLNLHLNETYSTSNHKMYEILLGVPEWLARLEDTIFEGLPINKAVKWPEQFAQAIPVGVDLEPIKYKFCAFILKENIDRVLSLDISEDLKKEVIDSIRAVLALHETAIKTGKWDESAESARSAESAAWSAAESAWSAAESAARSAAESAAWSAAESAWSARSAESAWSAESAAWSAAYEKYAKELLRLIKACK